MIGAALQVDASQPGAHCNLGVALQDAGQWQAAVAAFEQAVGLQPDYAIALNNLGNALAKLGRHDEAVTRYRQAIDCKPEYAEAHFHLGLALQSTGVHLQACDCLQRAIALRPDYADAWCAFGVSQHALHRYEQAIDSYDRALRSKPEFAEALCNRGNARQRLDALPAALADFDSAIAMRPDYARAHQCRGNTLRALGRSAEAIEAYRRAGAFGAEPSQINYLLAALGAVAAPAAAPASYVRELFDEYAAHFDQHLLENLGYAVPTLLTEVIARHIDGDRALDTLDLGCGTGLCASHCKPYSRSLVGVDLSPNMLHKAAGLDLYDGLHCAEAVAFLAAHPGQYDLIVAADVLVYFGDLGALFAAARNALRPGGRFGFSVESSDAGDIVLRQSHRYAHSLDYLQRQAQEQQFTVAEITRCPVRRDGAELVDAYLLVLVRAW